MNSLSKKSRILSIIKSAGLDHVGWVALETPPTIPTYKAWLDAKKHASMDYLVRHTEQKEFPQKLMPEAKSAIVATHSYWPHPRPQSISTQLQIARYARGEDYHQWFKEKLQIAVSLLEKEFESETFSVFVDSAPVLERDLATRAGLGWVGKNTCLINQERGSLFFIGEIYTSLEMEEAPLLAPDRCGTCTKCLVACPTQALTAERELDARRCISYWTIESKEAPPEELREHFKGWYFGCDICQTVCPWNQHHVAGLEEPVPDLALLARELTEILQASGKKIEKRWLGTPLSRARPITHKRNAILTAVHHQLSELRPVIESLKPQPELSSLVEWALSRLPSASKIE